MKYFLKTLSRCVVSMSIGHLSGGQHTFITLNFQHNSLRSIVYCALHQLRVGQGSIFCFYNDLCDIW